MLSFNVNGTSEVRLAARDWWRSLFVSYPVVCLQETRSVHVDPLLGCLEATHVPYVAHPPDAMHGKAGIGLATYVRREFQPGARAVPHPSGLVLGLTLQVQGTVLHVFNVYRPPSKALATLLDALDDCMAICGVLPGQGVLVCGDLNAHLPADDDRPVGLDGSLMGQFPVRAPAPGLANADGRDLVEWCRASRLLFLTGRLQDGPVQAASSSTRGHTRCDHCLVSIPTYAWVQEHRVEHVLGSDHLPLHTLLAVPAAGNGNREPASVAQGLQPLPSFIRWAPHRAEQFDEAVASHPDVATHLTACRTACDTGDAAAAVQALHGAMYAAAAASCMPIGPLPAGALSRHRRHQPWFDDECSAARIALREYGAAPPAAVLKHYEALLRRKKRRHGRRAYQRFMQLDQQDRRYFWTKMRGPRKPGVCPDPDATTAHFASVFGGASPAPQVCPVAEADHQSLINEEAVQAALAAIRGWSAPGAPGVPAQALKCSGVRPYVEAVLRCVHASNQEPPVLQEGLLCPIYKQRGSPLEPVNYRPIVVSSVLHKVYAHCLLRALHEHLGDQFDTLFPRQAGFLPGRDTMLNVLALHHMVSTQAARQLPLHVVLLDVSKAYDSVQLPMLVATLTGLAVPPHLVAAIVGLYAGLAYRIRFPEGLDPPFMVGMGVKQGCPLSPFLFNLYVAGLSAHLATAAPACGFLLPADTPGGESVRVPDFHYADDDLLADPNSCHLQGTIDTTTAYYAERNLHINVPKCVALHFNPQWGGDPFHPLSVGGQPIPIGPEDGSLYLGIMCDTTLAPATMADHRSRCLASAFPAALSNLRAAAQWVPASAPVVKLLLHMAAEPAGLYGCELWGLLGIRWTPGPARWGAFYSLSDPLERQRCLLLRKEFRIPHHVPKLALLHELGCVPFVHQYVLRAVGLYNRMRVAGPSYKAVLRHHVQQGLTGPPRQGKGTWIRALFDALRTLLPQGRWMRVFLALDPIPVGEVESALTTAFTTYTSSLQPVHTGPGSRIGFYFREVGTHPMGTLPSYLGLGLSRDCVRACMRFRLGCHFLRVQTGRVAGLPRPARLCQRCGSQVIDDEHHCLFSCMYPDLLSARTVLADSVSGHVPASMLHLFQCSDADRPRLRRVVRFVAQCYHIVESFHRAQQAGAAPPVVLHPALALLPADELDLFDSASSSSSSLPVDDHLDSLNSSSEG
ncbi:MAG: reverse transcriptase domain-containing protein [Cyanobium sp.]